ncbi:MFS family permease [Nonomuraea thailandensis]|uniref:MFS family permease n=1 Tax=Nonomuraea thailandensis TaxID=1188745 RepID=A0A9X2GNK7_9ACTN|nr:MFS transporter [Nonomuraea thailandensis]MCP2362594.1 MFS family permease [Nonomuraea thailandensis]
MTGNVADDPCDDRYDNWRRDFSLLWGGAAFSQLGTVCSRLAVPLLALDMTGSPVFAGWVAAAGVLPGVLLHLPIGVLVDRFDRYRVMVVSQVVQVFVALQVVAMLCLGGPPVMLPIAAALQGVCLSFYNTAELTAVQRIVPTEHLSGAMAKNEARRNVAMILGRPLGGFLFGLHRIIPFLLDVVFAVVALCALRGMRNKEFQAGSAFGQARNNSLWRDFRDGISYLRRETFLFLVLWICTITNFLFQALGLVFMVSAEQQGLSSFEIGVLLAAGGAGGLLGTSIASWTLRRLGAKLMVVVCVWTWLLVMVPVIFCDDVVMLMLVWAVIGFMGSHMNVALTVHQAQVVPEELLGRVVSVNRFFTGGAVPLGALASGYLMNVLDTQGTAVVTVVVIAFLALAITPGKAWESTRLVDGDNRRSINPAPRGKHVQMSLQRDRRRISVRAHTGVMARDAGSSPPGEGKMASVRPRRLD